MDKLDKLIILNRLMHENRYGVTLNTILEELECSPQTFHRVKELLLLKFHVAIKYNRTTRKYEFDSENSDRHELPGLWFKSGEIEALIYLENLLEDLHSGIISELLQPFKEKIGKILEAQDIRIDDLKQRVKIVPISNREVDPVTLKGILDGTIHRRKLEIEYRKLGERAERRLISPQRVFRYRDNWYVDSFCHLRSSLRTFSVDRIVSVVSLNESVTEVPKAELELYHEQSYGIYSGTVKNVAKIRFTGISAEMVAQEQWHRDAVGHWEGENYYLQVPYGNHHELVMDIMRWGESATVIEPQELRTAIQEKIRKTLQNYQ